MGEATAPAYSGIWSCQAVHPQINLQMWHVLDDKLHTKAQCYMHLCLNLPGVFTIIQPKLNLCAGADGVM